MTAQEHFRHWPTRPYDDFIPEEGEKLAYTYDEPSIEKLAETLRDVLPGWRDALPPGIEKVAEARDGVEELTPVTLQNIWRHPNAHPVALALLLLDKYGKSYLTWDSEVLRLTLGRDGIQLSNSVWAKIQAVRPLFNSPTPWRRWEAFHWVSQGLAGLQPTVEYMEEPELGYAAAAIDAMRLVDPKRQTEEDVDKFIAAALLDHNIVYAPPPLDFAQHEVDRAEVHCGNCGSVNRDNNDVRCVACASKNIKTVIPHAELRDKQKKVWEERHKKPLEDAVMGLGDDAVGAPVYRLLVHWDYRNRTLSQLMSQLRMIAKK